MPYAPKREQQERKRQTDRLYGLGLLNGIDGKEKTKKKKEKPMRLRKLIL
jgi:hypothetical protein